MKLLFAMAGAGLMFGVTGSAMAQSQPDYHHDEAHQHADEHQTGRDRHQDYHAQDDVGHVIEDWLFGNEGTFHDWRHYRQGRDHGRYHRNETGRHAREHDRGRARHQRYHYDDGYGGDYYYRAPRPRQYNWEFYYRR